MNLKKYIIVDAIRNANDDGDELKIKVVNGFTRDNVESALDVQKDWQPVGGGKDRLFFFPGANVPRFKVREHFSCTIKPEYATAAFLSRNTMEGSASTFDYYKDLMPVDNQDMINWAWDWEQSHLTGLLDSLIDNGNIEQIFASKRLWFDRTYDENFSSAAERFCDVPGTPSRHQFKQECSQNQFQLLGFTKKSGLSNLTAEIFFEDDILSHLNVGNFVIGSTKYEELRSFGATEEKENIILMMELMSNCDFEKSVVYLLFLLKEFGKEITSYKEAEHVNFKSLLSYLKISRNKLSSITINDMTRVLREHKKFTKANALRVSMLFAGDNIDYSNTNNFCWQSGPVLKDDCLTLLDN